MLSKRFFGEKGRRSSSATIIDGTLRGIMGPSHSSRGRLAVSRPSGLKANFVQLLAAAKLT